MKTSLETACRLMESVCQLPGVALLDWCDRAAAALTTLHTPAGAMVAVGRIENDGSISAVENSGAAWCGRTDDQPAASGPANPLRLESIRNGFAVGAQLGWGIPLTTGETRVVPQRVEPAISRRAASRLNRSWDALANCDLLLGSTVVPGSTPGAAPRRLVVELAMVNCPPEQLALSQQVLTAILPHIASRFFNALGPERLDRRDWLTAREEAILWRLVAGKKVPQIAEELHRSIYTVHDHVKSLHRKLGASNRGQLVSRALGHLGPLVADVAGGSEADEGDAQGDSPTGTSPRRSATLP